MIAIAPPNGFAVPNGDYVSHMFSMVFGPMWTAVSASGLSLAGLHAASGGPFAAAFRFYNGAIFTFATLWLAKMIFEGIAGTAYHGEWLGKTFHAFWTPMRIVLMLALVAPGGSLRGLRRLVAGVLAARDRAAPRM